MTFLPIVRMWNRVESAKNDADTTVFLHLMYAGEMLTKTVAAGLVACLGNDRDRTRYRQIHKLVRADGLGEWREVIDEVLSGPSASHLNRAAQEEQRELTQKLGPDSWQHQAVKSLQECLELCDPGQELLPAKVDGRRCFDILVRIRNATRGHGATATNVYSEVCPRLEHALTLLMDNLCLLRRPWAFLHRNLSGKYRVTEWSGQTGAFDSLKTGRIAEIPNLPDGVYLHLDGPVAVELLQSDQDATDFFFPNGKFDEKRFEVISYVSGNKAFADARPYLIPPNMLPESETRGLGSLDAQGKCFGNLPPAPTGYVARPALEKELADVLRDDRHPVVTLVGSGGIGKTSLALRVLHGIAAADERFDAIVWFSARDIDVLPEGPKVVRPQVLTSADMATQFVGLLEPDARKVKGFDANRYFSDALSVGPVGKVLYVFDNFETIRGPAETYKWLDTYIRLPNKILITTRFREFKGDYSVDVLGMEGAECDALVDAVAADLGIRGILTEEYRRQIQTESSGHPYVIKILLGEVAKARQLVGIERIVASRDGILDALFERTYTGLAPAARRVFLTLCGWRSVLPQVALDAVLLRSSNERMDVDSAVNELARSSLVELTTSAADQAVWVSVPLAASIFGRKKLAVSATKVAVDADIKILQSFGATQPSGIHRGIGPGIETLFRNAAGRIVSTDTLAEFLPILESVARKYPPAWLLLASIHEETASDVKHAKECVRRYLEAVPRDDQRIAWRRLGQLCASSGDRVGEIHALVELADLPGATIESISSAANRMNQLFREHLLVLDTEEKEILVKRLIALFETRVDEGDGVDFSRLAWLCLQLQDVERARKWTRRGLEAQPGNEHCIRLAGRLAKW